MTVRFAYALAYARNLGGMRGRGAVGIFGSAIVLCGVACSSADELEACPPGACELAPGLSVALLYEPHVALKAGTYNIGAVIDGVSYSCQVSVPAFSELSKPDCVGDLQVLTACGAFPCYPTGVSFFSLTLPAKAATVSVRRDGTLLVDAQVTPELVSSRGMSGHDCCVCLCTGYRVQQITLTESGSGEQGSPCGGENDCAPGYGCLPSDGNSTSICMAWCNPGSPMCPPGASCYLLPEVGEEYGYYGYCSSG